MGNYPTLEEDLVSLQKSVGKPLSEVVYYNRLSLEEKIKFIEDLYKKAKEDMKDPTDKDNPNQYWTVNKMFVGWNVEDAKKRQKHSCLCCGIGITEKYSYYSYLLKPHRIIYSFMKGDYKKENIVMLCLKCHDKEYSYWSENKKRLKTLETIKRESGTISRLIPLPWDGVIDVSFEIFKEFIIKNHESTDKEIENMIFQDVESEVDKVIC